MAQDTGRGSTTTRTSAPSASTFSSTSFETVSAGYRSRPADRRAGFDVTRSATGPQAAAVRGI